MDLLLITLLVFTLEQTIAVEPTISIICKGQHQYVDEYGYCRECEPCPAGQQPKEHCGYGERHIDYGCQVCPKEAFSLRTDYNVCVQCHPCEDWNSEIDLECSPENNRICGRCFEGFFRPLKSDGSRDDECHSCGVAARGTTECQLEQDTHWQIIAIFALAAVGALLVGLLVIGVCMCTRRRRRRRKKTEYEKRKGVKVHKPGDAETSESLVQSGSSRNSQISDDSRLDGEHRVDIEQESEESISNPVARSPKSLPTSCLSQTAEIKNDATQNPTFQSFSGNPISDSGYSNMPTAQFDESAPQSHDSQSPSNLPTGRYDVLHPSQVGAHLPHPSTNSPHSFISRGRRRPHVVDPSSSSENLLDNVDRNSRVVGGRRTPVNPTDLYNVEPFDTRSVSDETKPHELGSSG